SSCTPSLDDALPIAAAISIGTNPTFQGHLRQVEAHVLGRDDLDLYGDEVRVEFVSRLRPTLEFAGVEELVTQMRHDVLEAARVRSEEHTSELQSRFD